MYRLTNEMLQNFENNLKTFHQLFQGGRCQAWQLEELLAKAIRSDFSKSEKVVWKGNGHDIGCDIIVNDTNKIQIKSGQVKNNNIVISGHRLGRFKGNFKEITDFINSNDYLIISVPYYSTLDEHGKKHCYQLIYFPCEWLKVDNYENWKDNQHTNNNGVIMNIHPSMSWQIWWQIPMDIIPSENKSRVIAV